jgi:outer membrane protein W
LGCKNYFLSSFHTAYFNTAVDKYILAGLNKYYEHNKITYYAGAYTGYSVFKWDYNPMNNTTNNDTSSESPLIGLQGGLEYLLTQNISLDFNIKAMLHDNATQLEASTAKATIKHSSTVSAGMGIVYKFSTK